MEVQQEPAPAAAGAGELPPAPHGAASVMATLMTENGEAQSEGDAEMEQQAASGPSRSAAAALVRRVVWAGWRAPPTLGPVWKWCGGLLGVQVGDSCRSRVLHCR